MNYANERQAIQYIDRRLLEIAHEFEVCVSIRGKARLEQEVSALRTARNALERQMPFPVNDKTAPFSYACGTRLCPDCQHSIKTGQEFCDRCGRALKWEEDRR